MTDIGILELTNFVTYKKLKLNLYKRGTLLLKGGVGKGKSLIGDGITWVLFGDVVRNIAASSIIGKFGKYVLGKATLIIDDNKYVIKRRRDKGSITLTINGNAKATIDETQLEINELLGCNFLLWRNSVMFGQNDKKIFNELNDHGKKELFVMLYPELNSFKIGLKNINIEETKIKTSIAIAKQNIEEIKNDIDNTRIEVIAIKKAIKVEYKNKFKDYKEKIVEINKKLSKVIKSENKIRFDISIINIKECKLKHKKLDKFNSKLNKQVLATDLKVNELGMKIDAGVENIENFQCNTCGEKIKKSKLKNYIKDIKKELMKNKLLYKKLSKKYSRMLGKTDIIFSKITEHKDFTYFRTEKINRIKMLKKTKSMLIKPVKDDKLGILNYTKKKLRKQKNKLNAKIISVSIFSKKLERTQFWKFAFGDKGIKNKIMEEISPQLTLHANQHSNIVTGGQQKINIGNKTKLKRTTQEKISVTVTDSEATKILDQLSGGQRHAANLCTVLAFGDFLYSRIKNRINFRFYDEPFDNFDNEYKDNVVTLIDNFEKKYGTFLVISHDNYIENSFYNQIKVTKENGISKVVE